jgi:hypothetical protein
VSGCVRDLLGPELAHGAVRAVDDRLRWLLLVNGQVGAPAALVGDLQCPLLLRETGCSPSPEERRYGSGSAMRDAAPDLLERLTGLAVRDLYRVEMHLPQSRRSSWR